MFKKRFGTREYFESQAEQLLDDSFWLEQKHENSNTLWVRSQYKHVPDFRVRIRNQAYQAHQVFAGDIIPKDSCWRMTTPEELVDYFEMVQTMSDLRAGRHSLDE